MNRDDLRYDIKLLMSYNLTRIITLKDEKGICEKELFLSVPIESYSNILEEVKFMNMQQMSILHNQLKFDYTYLKEYEEAV
ncbi:MAG: hypothetical protein ACRCTZ_07805, partial [Sarcina sp.]